MSSSCCKSLICLFVIQHLQRCAVTQGKYVAELEIMIAERSSRRKGLAREVLQVFMCYAQRELKHLVLFTAKMGDANHASMKLFKSLGFVFYKHMEVFGQTELRLELNVETRQRLEDYWTSVNAHIVESTPQESGNNSDTS